VRVMRIATGDEAEDAPSPASAAAQLGKLGGAARAKALTKERRAEIARKGAAKRWGSRPE
jgi:general stress protein YciG